MKQQATYARVIGRPLPWSGAFGAQSTPNDSSSEPGHYSANTAKLCSGIDASILRQYSKANFRSAMRGFALTTASQIPHEEQRFQDVKHLSTANFLSH